MNESDDNPTMPPGDPGPNPAIGRPRLPHIEPPPTVIHALGGARPGEANPAQAEHTAHQHTGDDTTAESLSDRELVEEQIARSRPTARDSGGETLPGDTVYEDSGANVLPRDMQAGGRPNLSGAGEVTPLEYMGGPHAYTSAIGQAAANDPTSARIDAKVEANANAIERAESVSGLTYREGEYDYEQREFEAPHPQRDDVMVGAGTGIAPRDTGDIYAVSAFFLNIDQAQTAVQGLYEIGIAAEAVTLVGRGADAGAVVTPAGEAATRRSAPELPNDEDLPTTLASQADLPTDEAAPRAGLAADEGQITRVEAPADPQIYSDYVDSDADYRTRADEGAAQVGATPGELPEINAQRGAIAGGVTGLAVGLAALAIPGIGPILAAGPIVAALTGLVTGAVAGGLLGGLLHAGVPEAQARAYADRIEQGEVLVTVQTDAVTRPAVLQTLATYGGQDLQE